MDGSDTILGVTNRQTHGQTDGRIGFSLDAVLLERCSLAADNADAS